MVKPHLIDTAGLSKAQARRLADLHEAVFSKDYEDNVYATADTTLRSAKRASHIWQAREGGWGILYDTERAVKDVVRGADKMRGLADAQGAKVVARDAKRLSQRASGVGSSLKDAMDGKRSPRVRGAKKASVTRGLPAVEHDARVALHDAVRAEGVKRVPKLSARRAPARRAPSKWNEHVAVVRRANAALSFGEVVHLASKSYKRA
jgi:hypothetical protein